jgi:hypothetical protein
MHPSLRIALIIGFVLCFGSALSAQNFSIQKTVFLTASVQTTVPRITLNWEPDASATSYIVYRKGLTDPVWGNAFPSLPANATSYADSTAELGQAYEYRVVKTGGTTSYGYIHAGVERAPVHREGTVLLVLDTTYRSTFSSELQTWIRLRERSGWTVKTLEVAPSDAITAVKARIVDAYNQYPGLRSVLLFGRVPVPYSGNVVPDGHAPDHQGAWPADGYYGDMDGVWTDATVNNTGATLVRNQNIPGDGKFDQNTYPGFLELEVGRVDLSSITLGTEAQLLRKYLLKNNRFYSGLLPVRERALIDDNFTNMDEGFGASGWRSFTPIVGHDSILTTDYFTTMRQSGVLFSYGCGGGSYTQCGGLGNTADYGIDSLENVFTITFGSYFGDWDNTDNFLRSALASGAVLSNVWSGRPMFHFHGMGLGGRLGWTSLRNMNNTSVYDANVFQRGVFMALLGDPTLNAYPLRAVDGMEAHQTTTGEVEVNWLPLEAPGTAYYVYAREAGADSFLLQTEVPLTVTQYFAACPENDGIMEYLVRPVQLKTTPSGSFYRLGMGAADTAWVAPLALPLGSITATVTGNSVDFIAPAGASTYTWDFGDGNSGSGQSVSHTYSAGTATYAVNVVLENACESETRSVQVNIVGIETLKPSSLMVWPNPNQGAFRVSLQGTRWVLRDAAGRPCASGIMQNQEAVSVPELVPGWYVFEMFDSQGTMHHATVLIGR